MISTRTIFTAVLFSIALAACSAAYAASVQRFTSPKGRFDAVFTETSHKKIPKSGGGPMDFDEADEIVYRIDFYARGSKTPVVSTSYDDIIGWDYIKRPSTPEEIFNAFVWSPKEDFVIMPHDGLPDGPGTSARRAVALNRKLPWDEAHFALDDFVWTDVLSGVGDAHFDCDFSVGLFDGVNGKTVALEPGASPVGYELISVKGMKVFIRQTLDNCQTKYVPTYQGPTCFDLSLPDRTETPRPCPKKAPAPPAALESN